MWHCIRVVDDYIKFGVIIPHALLCPTLPPDVNLISRFWSAFKSFQSLLQLLQKHGRIFPKNGLLIPLAAFHDVLGLHRLTLDWKQFSLFMLSMKEHSYQLERTNHLYFSFEKTLLCGLLFWNVYLGLNLLFANVQSYWIVLLKSITRQL